MAINNLDSTTLTVDDGTNIVTDENGHILVAQGSSWTYSMPDRITYIKGDWVLYDGRYVLEIMDITINHDFYIEYRDPYQMGMFILPNEVCNKFKKIPKDSKLKTVQVLYK